MIKALSVHFVLLAVASSLSLHVWTRDEEAISEKSSYEVQVWGGTPDQIKQIYYEDEDRKVTLVPKSDERGRWAVARVDRIVKSPRRPHGQKPEEHGKAKPSSVEQRVERDRFVAVSTANELVEHLAPLKAERRVGKVESKRLKEFGFDTPHGKLALTTSAGKQVLVIGGTTPGGIDRYVKTSAGEIYVLGRSIIQDLSHAESRLIERELHGFAPEEVERVKIVRGTNSRELVKLKDKKSGWADASKPTTLDETVGNWMAKLERLRVMDYVEKPEKPVGPDALLMRVEYSGKNKPLGYLELYKTESDKKKPRYLARSEQSRWYVDVLESTSEQIVQDLDGVMK